MTMATIPPEPKFNIGDQKDPGFWVYAVTGDSVSSAPGWSLATMLAAKIEELRVSRLLSARYEAEYDKLARELPSSVEVARLQEVERRYNKLAGGLVSHFAIAPHFLDPDKVVECLLNKVSGTRADLEKYAGEIGALKAEVKRLQQPIGGWRCSKPQADWENEVASLARELDYARLAARAEADLADGFKRERNEARAERDAFFNSIRISIRIAANAGNAMNPSALVHSVGALRNELADTKIDLKTWKDCYDSVCQALGFHAHATPVHEVLKQIESQAAALVQRLRAEDAKRKADLAEQAAGKQSNGASLSQAEQSATPDKLRTVLDQMLTDLAQGGCAANNPAAVEQARKLFEVLFGGVQP